MEAGDLRATSQFDDVIDKAAPERRPTRSAFLADPARNKIERQR